MRLFSFTPEVQATGPIAARHISSPDHATFGNQSAYFWSLLASAQGDKNATKIRDLVERDLSPEQRAAAEASARNWMPKTAAQSSKALGGSRGLSVVQNRTFSGDYRFHAGRGSAATQTAARWADRRQARYSPPKRAILATVYS